MARRAITLADLPEKVRMDVYRQLREQGGKPSSRPAVPPLTPSGGTGSPQREKKGKKSREMNRTEAEFSLILERQKQSGEIIAWEYEGMKLRIGDPCCWYCPDFCAILPSGNLRFIETKGGFVREDALIKWKCAKHKFKHFEFQIWQKKNRQWRKMI